ncbi:MAG: CoA transferase [Chloroflexi bacterium]|nr:CoA transferase [Chloroflexota bacterium]
MLSGIRILDFTRVLAGPYCTMLLGDLGADILKVESPAGDETREWGPPWAGEGSDRQSAYYLAVNRNKRSLTLNLKTAEGCRIARDLTAHSQIVIENFKPGQMARFGLDFETLRALNPALVYASITGFGQSGPFSDRPGYDHVIQAMSGLMSITGPPDSDGYKVGVAVVDVFTGLFALSAVLAALRQAEQSGQGRHLDLTLLDSQLSALVNVASAALISGRPPARYGNAHAAIVPYQNFRAADTSFALAVGNDGQFASLCQLIGRRDLIADTRFASNPGRVAHRAALIAELEPVFAVQSAAYWVELCHGAGIPAGPVQNILQALSGEHAAAHHLLREVTLANGVTIPTVASPLLPDTPDAIRYPPPALGQHTAEILREVLSYSDGDIARLRQTGVL